MLDQLEAQAPDALLALIKMYAQDPRDDKIDLGVGVYRTNDGATPVFRSIKAAEQRLVDTQDSKSYLGPEGDLGFVDALKPYVFGADPTMGGRVEGMQTPGGTGAVRLAAALAKAAGVTRIHLGVPSWPNHAQILQDVGLEAVTFQHAKADGAADIDALLQTIADARDTDAVLLHGCCHNPSGVDYTEAQWARIADAFADKGILPILDVAYHGLGQGLEEDVAGVRKVLAKVPEALVAYSCDKNFGLYRDRVGAFYMIAKQAADLPAIVSNANALARANWSMPPDHGGAAVRTVLTDEELTQQWLDELDEMRARMRRVRERLAAADNEVPGLNLAALGEQNGLFAMLPLTKEQIVRMREDHGVYMAGSGRINVAGLHAGNTDKFIAALADVTAG
ncbi:MAG: aromatic amino acid transaminase [Pseudomonadota bacterium]|uniref:amino acid aminotransferase n=2 Tax=Erythrobacteraceae TaxID=335929 RepID=UPI000C93B89B|nr:aromatic amino acid transaminase [Erythrobacter sp. SAORIC-644]MAG40372.1 aromatic amino acid aminotransferase [Erythrobacteraceae bacterium]MBL4896769.1 aspartate/tyrosine/aromatic aminotransferase [Erythrobacter sp.]MEC7888901.1 aromatic amino acid transaminase [Pseudomonadota bacterium]MCH2498256.1 aromatic amino acid transaminase [Erythrobacter sp.]MEE2793922.1 aromatic amino acid transaminase [Pseudomonadota bacterium]